MSRSSGRFPIDLQEQFGRRAVEAIGFDFSAGRLDVTDHPFCTTLGPRDVRLTTRYDENFLPGAFFSTLHEAGHGIYEQGLPAERYGLPTGEAVSLGIHESQSRMWENLVGRSRAFWEHFFPQAAGDVSREALADVSLDDFYFAINDVRPSLIRTESDEATYNLHILIRFELEQALLLDELRVADLPAAWREKYRHYLGIESPNDADGVLQDVHWSSGAIGYFPTYSLGNLYAAQLFEQAGASWATCTPCFAAASSCRCAIGCASTSIRTAVAIRPPSWPAASPACRYRTTPCCVTSAANSPRSTASLRRSGFPA